MASDSMPADWQIAKKAEENIKPIHEIAEKLGLTESEIIPMGRHLAKIDFIS